MTDILDLNQQREAITKAATYLSGILEPNFKNTANFKPPRTLIICGSGLGGISSKLSVDNPPPVTIPYQDIPGFKKSTVPGHSGTLMFGSMNGSPVVLMNGRLHGYEGNTLFETIFPIRVLNHMGHVHNIIVTNAAGGLNAKYQACDLMCIYDHLNIPGLAGQHPLRGPNLDEVGPRFLALSDAYDLELRKLLFKKWKELKIHRPLHEGTYTFVSGPTFETRAESKMIRMLGGDAVGMSTVPEVIVARHCGWRVLALSLITNNCVVDNPASALEESPVPLEKGKATHAEVLENGKIASNDVQNLIAAVVEEL